MVTQNKQPRITASNAKKMPLNISHKILHSIEPAPPPYTISFPNGKNAKPANLKHCTPIGIPTMVRHHTTPDNAQLIPIAAPPKINHNAFPKHPTALFPSSVLPDIFVQGAVYTTAPKSASKKSTRSRRTNAITAAKPCSAFFPRYPLFDENQLRKRLCRCSPLFFFRRVTTAAHVRLRDNF